MARLIQNYVCERKTVPFYSELDASSPELLCSLPESRDEESQLNDVRPLAHDMLPRNLHCELGLFITSFQLGMPELLDVAGMSSVDNNSHLQLFQKSSFLLLLPGRSIIHELHPSG